MNPLIGGLRSELFSQGVKNPLIWRGRAKTDHIAVAGFSPVLNPTRAKLLLTPADGIGPQHRNRLILPFGLDAYLHAEPEHGYELLGQDRPYLLIVLLPEHELASFIGPASTFLHANPHILVVVAVTEPCGDTGGLADVAGRFGLERRFEVVDVASEEEISGLIAGAGALLWRANDWEYPQAVFGAAVLGVPAVVAGNAEISDIAIVCRVEDVSAGLEATFGQRFTPRQFPYRWSRVASALKHRLHQSAGA